MIKQIESIQKYSIYSSHNSPKIITKSDNKNDTVYMLF